MNILVHFQTDPTNAQPREGREETSSNRPIQVAAALRELEMPTAAHLPIVRLWTAKLARDPTLSLEVLQAVSALRGGAVP